MSETKEDTQIMRGLVFEVRNKNDPAEENIPGNNRKDFVEETPEKWE